MRVTFSVLCLSLLAPAMAFAQEPVPPPPPPPPPPAAEVAPMPPAAPMVAAPVVAAPAPAPAAAAAAPTWKDLLTVEGLVDSYYMISLTHPDGGGIGSSPVLRQFDTISNSFSLAYAKLGIGMSAGPAAFRIDLGYGHTGAIINNASFGNGPAPTMSADVGDNLRLYDSAFIVQQAYASLTPVENLTFDFGKFVTNAGSEVIEANKNWLYSRSLLFYTIPLLHTGVRAGYKVGPTLIQLSLVNGINNDPDTAAVDTFGKTVGATINYTDGPVTAIINYYGGHELQTGPKWKHTGDFVGGFTVNDKVALNLNIDYIKVDDRNTWGAALMGKFVLTDALYLSARGEFVQDKLGLSFGVVPGEDKVSYYEGTAMLGVLVGKNLEVRPELRADFSDKEVFGTKKNQVTGTLAVLAFL